VNQLFFDRFFPYTRRSIGIKKRRIVTLGIGGNIGDVRARFQKLFFYLGRDRRWQLLETAPILKNPPFGYRDQADFYNSIIVLATEMHPTDLLKCLLHIEKRFKRVREFKNSPRTLDIDILFFDKIVHRSRRLTIPHPKWRERESVTVPLSFIKESLSR
jgi:2-amino-4-hydroxy-6-hydroxymethyldihydropteridine diphosphokinase